MARPQLKRKAVRFSVSLDVDAYEKLASLASLNETTVSWIVRRAVNDFIDSQSSPPSARRLALRKLHGKVSGDDS
jgi:predicted transcriptional regulator